MAYIKTDNNCITILCPKCGQEAKVDVSIGISNGIEYWHDYCCPHCGHFGSIGDNEHRTYSADEILEVIEKKTTYPRRKFIEKNCRYFR